MTKQHINVGSAELAGDGESIRSAFSKINDNFDELYAKDATDFDGSYNSLTDKPTIPQTVDLNAVTQSIIPDTDVAYDIGSATNRFRDLYLSGNTIDLGGLAVSTANGKLSVGGVTIPTQSDLDQALVDVVSGTVDLTPYATNSEINLALGLKADLSYVDDIQTAVNADLALKLNTADLPTIPVDISDLTDNTNLLQGVDYDQSLNTTNSPAFAGLTVDKVSISSFDTNTTLLSNVLTVGADSVGSQMSFGRNGFAVQQFQDPEGESNKLYSQVELSGGIARLFGRLQTLDNLSQPIEHFGNVIAEAGRVTVQAYTGGTPVEWQFDETGITFPDATVQTTAYPGIDQTLNTISDVSFNSVNTALLKNATADTDLQIQTNWNEVNAGQEIVAADNQATDPSNFITVWIEGSGGTDYPEVVAVQPGWTVTGPGLDNDIITNVETIVYAPGMSVYRITTTTASAKSSYTYAFTEPSTTVTNTNTWAFNSTGSLVFPDLTQQATAWTGKIDFGILSSLAGEQGDEFGRIILTPGGDTFICTQDWRNFSYSATGTEVVTTNQDFAIGQTGGLRLVWSVTAADYTAIRDIFIADGWDGTSTGFTYSHPEYFTITSADVANPSISRAVIQLGIDNGGDMYFHVSAEEGDPITLPTGSQATVDYDVVASPQPDIWSQLNTANPFDQALNTTDNAQFARVGLTLGEINVVPEVDFNLYVTPGGETSYNLSLKTSGVLQVPNTIAGTGGISILPDNAETLAYLYLPSDADSASLGVGLGNDNGKIELRTNNQLTSSAYTWKFDNDGTLTLPNNTKIQDGLERGLTLFGPRFADFWTIPPDNTGWYSASNGVSINVERPISPTETKEYNWTFAWDGSLYAPSNVDRTYSQGGMIEWQQVSGRLGYDWGSDQDIPIGIKLETFGTGKHVKISTNFNYDWVFGDDGSLTFPDNTIQSTALIGDRTRLVGQLYTEAATDALGNTVGGQYNGSSMTAINFGPDELNISLFNITTVATGTITGSNVGSSTYGITLTTGTVSPTLTAWAVTPTDITTTYAAAATFHYLGELVTDNGDGSYLFSDVILEMGTFPAGTEIRFFDPNGTLRIPTETLYMAWATGAGTNVTGVIVDGDQIYSSNPVVVFVVGADVTGRDFPVLIQTAGYTDSAATLVVDPDKGFQLRSANSDFFIETDNNKPIIISSGGFGNIAVQGSATTIQGDVSVSSGLDVAGQGFIGATIYGEDPTLYLTLDPNQGNGLSIKTTNGTENSIWKFNTDGSIELPGATVHATTLPTPGYFLNHNEMQFEVTGIDGSGVVTAITVVNSPNPAWITGTGGLALGDVNFIVAVDGSGNATVTINSSGSGHSLGEAFALPAEAFGAVGETVTALDVAKQVQVLSGQLDVAGLYSLADGAEGQIMYFVPSSTVTSTVYVQVANARIISTIGSMPADVTDYVWNVFAGGTTEPSAIRMAIFADGAWCLQGGTTD